MPPSLSLPTRSWPLAAPRWLRGRPLRSPPLLRLALAVLTAAALGAGGVAALPWVTQQATPVTACDALRQACTARFADGTTLTLRLQPQGHSAGAPLRASVQTGGFAPRSLTLDLDGETMAMGPNHLDLQPDPAGANSAWQGDAALSACLSGPMGWVATLRARSGLGERVARLRFVSGAP